MRHSRRHRNPPRSARTRKAAAILSALFLAALGIQAVHGAARATADQAEILGPDPLAAFTETKGDPAPQYQVLPVKDSPDFSKALQITTTAAPKSAGLDGEYEMTLGVQTAAPVQANDAGLATFWARSITPPAGSDAGSATFVFERDGGSYRKSVTAALQLTPHWQKFTFPFRFAEAYAPGEAHANLWLGYGAQTLQIAGVSVTDWGPGDPAGFPKVTYQGEEADAAWRKAADQRIDRYRKGDLTVRVVDTHGRPVPGASVTADMQSHAFDFGTAVDAATMMQNTSDGQKYRQAVTGGDFNQITFANDLKWARWETPGYQQSITQPAMKWVRQQGMAVRGHNLVWPSWGNLPADLQTLQNDPAALRARIDGHITDEAGTLTGDIDKWDVVNEPYSDHNLQDILGPDEIDRWYALAKQADPKARTVLNDYGAIENNGWSTRHQDYLYNLAQQIEASGSPIQGLGLESHFTAQQPTPPQTVYALLNRYASLGLPLEATEFDIATDDQQLQADYTRDFLTILFSQPDVTAISNFGIWAGNSYNPQTSLYNLDWSLKPNGQVWHDLVTKQWWTDASGTTGASGSYRTRGFLGDYAVTVKANGATEKVHVHMPSRQGATVTVVADGISSDDTNLLGNNADAELGSVDWYGFAPSTVQAETTTVHSGTGAIRSTGRTAEWQGPAAGVQVESGQSYDAGAWVRLASGDDTTAQIRIKLAYTDGTSESIPLASAPVSTRGWSELKSPSPVALDFHGKTLSKAEWWVSTAAGTGDLLLDDASLTNGA